MIGYEPVLQAVLDRIQAAIPGRLTAITTEYGDGIPLPEPVQYRLAPERDEQAYPVLYVLPGGRRPEGVQTGGWLTTVTEAVVYLEHRHQHLQTLGACLMRYERAVMEAVMQPAAPPPAHGLRWTGTRPGPLFDPDDTNQWWQSFIQLTFELLTYEEDR